MLLHESLLPLLERIVPLLTAEVAVCLGKFSAGKENFPGSSVVVGIIVLKCWHVKSRRSLALEGTGYRVEASRAVALCQHTHVFLCWKPYLLLPPEAASQKELGQQHSLTGWKSSAQPWQAVDTTRSISLVPGIVICQFLRLSCQTHCLWVGLFVYGAWASRQGVGRV